MRLRRTTVALALVAGTLLAPQQAWADYLPKTPPLTTPWTSQVSLTNPHPEYPRPQLTRPEWQNLNGQWQFTRTTSLTTPPVGQTLPETVLVPFPIESALSGIMRHENNMWYRRTFTVPSGWTGRRVQLNFGAVMWRASVWVNGVSMGTHSGGYDPFSFDVTSALRAGTNEVIVGVHAPVDAAGWPVGKQRLNPSGIFYTAASGIWQTVWLEPTTPVRITRLDTTPNVAAGALDLVVQTAGGTAQNVVAEVVSGGTIVGSATGVPGQSFRVPVPNARLWSPDDPFLYDLRVRLTGTGGGDAAGGYFGMRSLGKAMVGGVLRPLLNGKFVFQMGTLDQGYWPDGIYTAPTDAALRFDLEQQKALGFNTVRKHVKVEPARWFYHADRLGLLVWQDMPSMRTGVNPSTTDRANFETELRRMIDNWKGITSIVQWVPFNEGWGEYDPARIADLVKSWDPTRLVNNNSGSNCCGFDGGNGDVIDDHIYVGPGLPQLPTATRIAVLGEYGGLGLRVPGHEWPGNPFAYEMLPTSAALTQRYVAITGQLRDLVTTRGLSASIYTEPTDLENEVNGFFTYDRQIRKMDFAQVLAVNNSVKAAAQGTYIPANQLVSLRVTTAGHTNKSLTVAGALGITSIVDAASTDAAKRDATFWARPGLAAANCFSFESRSAPGQFLRHSGYRVRRDVNDGTAVFRADATFCARAGLGGGGSSLESYNMPGRYLRHINSEVYVSNSSGTNPWDNPASFAADATWAVTTGWWRSGADLPLNAAQSMQVMTPGFTDRYLRHSADLVYTEVVNAGSSAVLKADATYYVRRGLADPTCYSFESRNFPGHYLRHANFRVRKDPSNGTALFNADATFCAQPGRYGSGGITLDSINIGGYRMRHYSAEVWIAAPGGPNPSDNPASYDADVTWRFTAPWAP